MSNFSRNGEQPCLFLEITNGRTKFPRRPVFAGRFLIGSDAECDLSIGDMSIPTIHSMLIARPDRVVIAPFTDDVELYINEKRIVSTYELSSGDEVAIGAVKLKALDPGLVVDEIVPMAVETVPMVDAQTREKDITDLTVEELVGLLEADMNLVDEYETGISLGMRAMKQAAFRTQPQAELEVACSALVSGGVDATRGLDTIIDHLNSVSDELAERAIRLDERERRYNIAAEELSNQQELLQRQLEALSARLNELGSEPQQELRKSA